MKRPFWSLRTSAFLRSAALLRSASSGDCETLEPLLSLFADGMASPEEARRINAHLPGCADCRAALSWMQATHTALSSRPVAVPPPDLHSRIALAIAASSAAPVSLRPARVFTLRTAYAAAASVTVLGIAVSYSFWHAPGEVAVKRPVNPVVAAARPNAASKTNTALKTTKPPLVASAAVKPAAIKHMIIARKAVPLTVMQTQHTASSITPTHLPAVPQTIKASVPPASTTQKIASRLAPAEKRSIKEQPPLPAVKTAVPKTPDTLRVAKIVKEPIRVPYEVQTPKITPDAIVQPAPVHEAALPKSDDLFGQVKASLRVQNATYIPLHLSKQDISRSAANMMQAVGNDDHTAFVDAIHGNR